MIQHEWAAQKLDNALRKRFFLYVHPEPNTGCWLWSGGYCKGGYGAFSVRKGDRWGQVKASHVSLALDGRPLPSHLIACHSCDFPPCVNPDHLFSGTYKDNNIDCVQKKRRGKRPQLVAPPIKTWLGVYREICCRGHLVTGDNVYLTPGGYDECRACRILRKEAFDQKRRLMKMAAP